MIFSTKNREPIITSTLQPKLYSYIGGIIRGEGGILIEIGGISNHIHLLTNFRQDRTVSEMLQRIKGKSSKWVNEQNELNIKFHWQSGYASFTVSESRVEAVVNYIRNQEEHHRHKTFEEEYEEFLRKKRHNCLHPLRGLISVGDLTWR